jgi:hypothetical protein
MVESPAHGFGRLMRNKTCGHEKRKDSTKSSIKPEDNAMFQDAGTQ